MIQIRITASRGRVVVTVTDASAEVITEVEGSGENLQELEAAVLGIVRDALREAHA